MLEIKKLNNIEEWIAKNGSCIFISVGWVLSVAIATFCELFNKTKEWGWTMYLIPPFCVAHMNFSSENSKTIKIYILITKAQKLMTFLSFFFF